MKLLNAKRRKSQLHINIEEGLNSLIDGCLIKSWQDLEIKDKITFTVTLKPVRPVEYCIIDVQPLPEGAANLKL